MNDSNTPLVSTLDSDPLALMAQRLGITTTTSGASFSLAARAIALGIALACVYGAWSTYPQLVAAQLPQHIWVLLAGCLGLVAYTVFWIFYAKTTLTPTYISQTYVFNRRMHLGELAAAKFVYVPYLTWLIAPRLFVRSASGKFTAIYGATPELQTLFGQIHRVVNAPQD
jgi:hypothetical protein